MTGSAVRRYGCVPPPLSLLSASETVAGKRNALQEPLEVAKVPAARASKVAFLTKDTVNSAVYADISTRPLDCGGRTPLETV